MSFKKNIEIKCPKCTEKQKFEVWQLINVTEYPELKVSVFSQDIFKFTCDKCKESGIILYPLIYHDESNKFFVYFNPEGDFSNIENQEGYRIKTAKEYLEFLEVVKFLEDSIAEDKVVNAKNTLLNQFKNNEKLKNIDKVYYAGNDGKKISFYIPQINGKISLDM